MSLPDEYYDSPFKYFHCGNSSRGATPIDEELGLICYLAAYGRLHKEKLLLALNHMRLKSICPQRINIVDWGCGQGLASLFYSQISRYFLNDWETFVKKIVNSIQKIEIEVTKHS